MQVWSYHDNLIQQLFDIVSNNLCISNSSDDGKSLRDLTHDWPAKGQSLNLNDNLPFSPYVVEYIDCDQKKGSGARIDEWYVRLCSSFLLILISELVIHKIVRTLLQNHTKIARRISQKTKKNLTYGIAIQYSLTACTLFFSMWCVWWRSRSKICMQSLILEYSRILFVIDDNTC